MSDAHPAPSTGQSKTEAPENVAPRGDTPGLTLEDLLFTLPEELIAQEPLDSRDGSRLLVYDRDRSESRHAKVRDLPDLLDRPTTLVFNDTRVLRARLVARRRTGARVSLLITHLEPPRRFRALARPASRLKTGEVLPLQEGSLTVVESLGEGCLLFEADRDLERLLEGGRMPLPPYIRRDPQGDPRDEADAVRYQTVFARAEGAIAAPTAGLHFTPELLDAIRAGGHEIVFVTLHVGAGTFAPIRENDLDLHRMHTETFSITEDTAARLGDARRLGRPILAVGTTTVRTLETVFDGSEYRAGSGETSIFIRPPQTIRSVDAMMTNFHLPGSTLIALVSSFMGLERLMPVYAEAIAMRYRFYSYGDAMLIR